MCVSTKDIEQPKILVLLKFYYLSTVDSVFNCSIQLIIYFKYREYIYILTAYILTLRHCAISVKTENQLSYNDEGAKYIVLLRVKFFPQFI